MRYDDFWNMTLREFTNACEGYRQKTEEEMRVSWEQTRELFAVIHNKPVFGYKIRARSMKSLMPFPWDDKDEVDYEEEIENIKERRKWRQER